MQILEQSSVCSLNPLSQGGRANTVTAIIFCFRTAFGSVMAAVFLAILSSKVPKEIAAYVPAAALKAGLPQSSLKDLFTAIAAGTPKALAAVPGITPEIELAVAESLSNAYAAAYAYVYYAAIAVGGVGLIACICIKDYDKFFTDHVPRQIYRPGAEKNLTLDEKTDPEYASRSGSTQKGATVHDEATDGVKAA